MEIKVWVDQAVSSHLKAILVLLGRIAFSLIFIMAGFDKLLNYSSTLEYIILKGIPYANCLLILSIVMELGGGILVLLGWKTRVGALLLALFLIPVTFIFHSFWTFEQASAQNQMHHFMKNLSILGGTLYIIAHGGGTLSLDNRNKPVR